MKTDGHHVFKLGVHDSPCEIDIDHRNLQVEDSSVRSTQPTVAPDVFLDGHGTVPPH